MSFLGALAAILIGWAFVAIARAQIGDGRLFVEDYPADTAFVIDVILRIAAGHVPHVDFTLHLGAMPYLLAAATGGATPVESFLIGQAIFTGLCLLLGLWIWWTRLGPISGPVLRQVARMPREDPPEFGRKAMSESPAVPPERS